MSIGWITATATSAACWTRDGLTTAWLSSSLRISAAEQVAFVRRLVRQELPVSRSATERTMAIMPVKVVDGWRISGKTGTGSRRLADGTNDRERQVGWFVGWATRDGRTLVFARLLEDDKSEQVRAGWRARDSLFADWPTLMAQAQRAGARRRVRRPHARHRWSVSITSRSPFAICRPRWTPTAASASRSSPAGFMRTASPTRTSSFRMAQASS